MSKHSLLLFTLLTSVLLFQGCTKLGPDYTPPPIPKLPAKWDQNLTKSDPKILDWWKQFNDPTLNILTQKAYEENLDLSSAGVRILQARAALGISEAFTTPQKRTVSASAFQIRNKDENFKTADGGFDMGWELDVWGQYARGVESSEAQYYATIASYDTILVTLISEVARNYIDYQTSQERINYALQNINIQKRIVRMTQVQYKSGTVSELDMQQALTQLHLLEASIPAFELQAQQSINALAVLLGTTPDEVKPIIMRNSAKTPQKDLINTNLSSYVQRSKKAPDSSLIPSIALDTHQPINASELLKRPDLQVAEFQIRSKNAQIGIAQADLYPHFSLLGSIGYSNSNLSGNWLSDSKVVNIAIGPSITWNPFYPDYYQNQVRIADAQLQDSIINYSQKVLNAVQEVTNALQGYQYSSEQYALNLQAFQSAARAFNLSSIQYDNGMVTYQRVLSTMESITKTQDNLALIKGNIALNAIAFYKSLGGGLQLGENQSYLRPDIAQTMQKRTDWGNFLDANQTIHPRLGE
jgi:outer membrane protein TolC